MYIFDYHRSEYTTAYNPVQDVTVHFAICPVFLQFLVSRSMRTRTSYTWKKKNRMSGQAFFFPLDIMLPPLSIRRSGRLMSLKKSPLDILQVGSMPCVHHCLLPESKPCLLHSCPRHPLSSINFDKRKWVSDKRNQIISSQMSNVEHYRSKPAFLKSYNIYQKYS